MCCLPTERALRLGTGRVGSACSPAPAAGAPDTPDTPTPRGTALRELSGDGAASSVGKRSITQTGGGKSTHRSGFALAMALLQKPCRFPTPLPATRLRVAALRSHLCREPQPWRKRTASRPDCLFLRANRSCNTVPRAKLFLPNWAEHRAPAARQCRVRVLR